MVLFLRSLLFYIGMILALVVWCIIITPLILPLPYRRRYFIMIQWGYFVVWWLEKTCQVSHEVQGLENITKSPAIVLGKHQSEWETYAFQQIFPMQVWLLKRELLWIPLFGWALATLKPIVIDRKNIRKSMQKIVLEGKQRLAQGLWVIIFPEGTRVLPGEKKRFGIGGAMLAAQTGCPVIPVAHNSGRFWLLKRFVKKPGVIQIVIGPAIESKGKTAKEINALAQTWIEDTMVTLEGGDEKGE